MKTYSAARSSGKLSLSQAIRAANLQTFIVFNDKSIFKTYLWMFIISLVAGLPALQTAIGVEIIVGVFFTALSSLIGAYFAMFIAEYTQCCLKWRYIIWMVISLLALLLLSFVGSYFIFFGLLWWAATMLSLVVIIAITHSHYGSTLHFTNFLKTLKKNDLQEMLPEHLRGEVVCLSARDKYTAVMTDKGVYELRLTLSDAIEKNNKPGMRIHRSHWVSQSHITIPKRQGKRWFMHVEETILPVSPQMAHKVQAKISKIT